MIKMISHQIINIVICLSFIIVSDYKFINSTRINTGYRPFIFKYNILG